MKAARVACFDSPCIKSQWDREIGLRFPPARRPLARGTLYIARLPGDLCSCPRSQGDSGIKGPRADKSCSFFSAAEFGRHSTIISSPGLHRRPGMTSTSWPRCRPCFSRTLYDSASELLCRTAPSAADRPSCGPHRATLSSLPPASSGSAPLSAATSSWCTRRSSCGAIGHISSLEPMQVRCDGLLASPSAQSLSRSLLTARTLLPRSADCSGDLRLMDPSADKIASKAEVRALMDVMQLRGERIARSRAALAERAEARLLLCCRLWFGTALISLSFLFPLPFLFRRHARPPHLRVQLLDSHQQPRSWLLARGAARARYLISILPASRGFIEPLLVIPIFPSYIMIY